MTQPLWLSASKMESRTPCLKRQTSNQILSCSTNWFQPAEFLSVVLLWVSIFFIFVILPNSRVILFLPEMAPEALTRRLLASSETLLQDMCDGHIVNFLFWGVSLSKIRFRRRLTGKLPIYVSLFWNFNSTSRDIHSNPPRKVHDVSGYERFRQNTSLLLTTPWSRSSQPFLHKTAKLFNWNSLEVPDGQKPEPQ